MSGKDRIWLNSHVVESYLRTPRLSFPGAEEQLYILKHIAENLDRPVVRILDLGCGSGLLGSFLLEQIKDSFCIFSDFSEIMLNNAKHKNEKNSNRSDYCLVDYSEPDWINRIKKRGPFDLVVSGYSIHHQPDKKKKEIYRDIFSLLSPGGFFLNVEHVRSAGEWGEMIHDKYFVKSLTRNDPRNRNEEEVRQEYLERADKAANILAAVEEQCHWLRNIGYSDVDCFQKIFELCIFGGRRPVK